MDDLAKFLKNLKTEKRRQGPHLPHAGYTVWAWPSVNT